MVIENIMYFALGLLLAALLALTIMPAVWKRAVRLTKKRIEAATPISMAEFRADKDQLRAEFALSTRRLEMSVESLRRRLADQLRDINRSKNELGGIRTERDQHLTVVHELEEKEAELRRRNLELEKETADLAQKLRMRDREYAEKVSQLDELRASMRKRSGTPPALDGHALTGTYEADVAGLVSAIEAERKRIAFLEEQNRALIVQLESSDQSSETALETATELRGQLARDDAAEIISADNLAAAEARLANPANDTPTTVTDAGATVGGAGAATDLLRAEKLTLEDELERLRNMVADTEAAVMTDWSGDEQAQAVLRGRLDRVAGAVNQLVRAIEGEDSPAEDGEENLFERVQRFIEESERSAAQAAEAKAATKATTPDRAVSDRLRALREMQDGN